MNKKNLPKIKPSKDLNFQVFKFSNWLIILFIASCAQTSAPTGGAKDTTPPKITKSNPENYTTNFHQKTINIAFDEWILPFTNAQNQIIISPDVQPFPKIEAVRNELSIKFKDTLQSNITYSIFFGDNLKDNNEGNPYPNFKYIFSTGNFIDSLKVKGSVKTVLEKIPDNTYLLLYKDINDSAFTKKRPFYITKISNDGNFNLENVKEGIYKIYVLSDKNGNYFYDLVSEEIGFTDSIYHINSNIDSLSFNLFLPEDTVLRIYSYDRIINDGIVNLVFNKELSFNKDEITVEVSNNPKISPIAFQNLNLNLPKSEGSKIAVYLPKLERDTNSLTLIFKNNGLFIDSIHIRTEFKNSKNPIQFFTDTTLSTTIFETQPLKLLSSRYSMLNIDINRFFITDTSKVKIPFSISRNEDLQTYLLNASWKPGMKYKLQILDSALSDLVGNYNKMQEISFSVQPVKKAGNLLITYELPQKNHQYIALLKDISGKVLNKHILRDSQTVKINYGLQNAGTFSVELIDDANENGIWNSGNFKNKTLPEKIYKEPKPIVIKENWDAEEIIKVDFNLNVSSLNNINTNSKTPTKDTNQKMNKELPKGIFGE
jgi:hypothetical protein